MKPKVRALDNYIRRRDGGICVYCRNAVGTEREHIIPRFYNGPSIRQNLVLCCRRCNYLKGSNLDEQWISKAFQHLLSVGESLSWVNQWLQRRLGPVDVPEPKPLLQGPNPAALPARREAPSVPGRENSTRPADRSWGQQYSRASLVLYLLEFAESSMPRIKCELCGRTVPTDRLNNHACPHGQPCEARVYRLGIKCRKCHREHRMYREWELRNTRIRKGA